MGDSQDANFEALLDTCARQDALHDMFGPLLVLRDEPEEVVLNGIHSKVVELFARMATPEMLESGLKSLVAYIGKRSTREHVERLFDVLELLVESSTISPKSMCKALLSSDYLNVKNKHFWMETFSIIESIVPGVDYKGVRDIVNWIIQKCGSLPKNLCSVRDAEAKAVKEALEKITDREICLLPGYFVINEILKSFPMEKNFPHWIVGETLTKFIDGCRPAAQMVFPFGRSAFLPVVDHCSAACLGSPGFYYWKLDPISLKFHGRGHLPHPRDNAEPQGYLLRHVLRQFYSRELICSMISIQKHLKMRSTPVEHELVTIFLETMEKCAEPVTPSTHRSKVRHKKRNLGERARKRPREEGGMDDENEDQIEKKLKTFFGSEDGDGEFKFDMTGGSSGSDGGFPDFGRIKKEFGGRHDLLDDVDDEEAGVDTYEDGGEDGDERMFVYWHHLSTQLIYLVLYQFVSYYEFVTELHRRLELTRCRRGRDQLMWVLLQFISGSIQKTPTSDFVPVIKLFELLYPEEEPLPIPNVRKQSACYKMAPVCIWIHLMRKATTENVSLGRGFPKSLTKHLAYLQELVSDPSFTENNPTSDFRFNLLCNAFSTNQDIFPRPMGMLVEAIHTTTVVTPMPGMNCTAGGMTTPLPLQVLDSLTVHAKMSLIHSIVTNVLKFAQGQSKLALSPAMVETYARLLVYTEIDSLGIKGFVNQLMPTVFKCGAWHILYTLFEMFSYRFHHVQSSYRIQLLSQVYGLTLVPHANHSQIHVTLENTALRLMSGIGNAELQIGGSISRVMAEAKMTLAAESEELNRVLVLILARTIYMSGISIPATSSPDGPPITNPHIELLNTIMNATPLSWPQHTLNCFPSYLAEFFADHPVNKDNKHQIKKQVEEEYRKWCSMTNEKDLVGHFSLATNPPHLFLCLLWKIVLETNQLNPTAYKVLDRIGARALASHLRTFCDYFVHEFANSGHAAANRYIEAVNDLIWKFHVLSIDRFILSLVSRNLEGSEAQVCFIIIQLMLVKSPELVNRVRDFVNDNSPEHWKISDGHERHMRFHSKYPETFAPEGVLDQNSMTMPMYFGNVCLRFLPVFDIVIHRYLEIDPVASVARFLDIILEPLGGLYRFHDRPITFLYSTLYYYEKRFRGREALKRRLVAAVMGYDIYLNKSQDGTTVPSSQNFTGPMPIRTATNTLTSEFMAFVASDADTVQPDEGYFKKIVARLNDAMDVKDPELNEVDWRFNEFPNPGSHYLYLSRVELMALGNNEALGESMIDFYLRNNFLAGSTEELDRMANALGLLMGGLPHGLWLPAVHKRLLTALNSKHLLEGQDGSIFIGLNVRARHPFVEENEPGALDHAYLMHVVQAIYTHVPFLYFEKFNKFVKEEVEPNLQHEEQLVYLFHLICPIMTRVNQEGMRGLQETTILLYQLLLAMDRALGDEELKYLDSYVDVLYHIKYTFTGDLVKNELDKLIRQMRPALKRRLRFITHLHAEETTDHDDASKDGSIPGEVSSGGDGNHSSQNASEQHGGAASSVGQQHSGDHADPNVARPPSNAPAGMPQSPFVTAH